MKNILVVFCLLLLSACGWHLKGSLKLPADFTHIAIEGASTELHAALAKQLNASGIAIEPNAANARYHLVVSDEKSDRRTAALGSDALAAQYEYTSLAQFEFRNQAGELMGTPDQVQVTRTVNFDSGQVLGAASEAELVKREMTQELASQIIRRLSYLASRTQADTPATEPKGADGSPAS
ncbi:LPS assembly lipoprotein LptE [Simiduia sp. 21SJ11W-1]|uniref:LPS-assembly lipoprotein LptE n=1 Tax=Simiduia sp. 21SJ11W-1 TaxID=2909669 RepID=UPI0020A1175B|nr:LPS assembly lipoprotein LptE [Simiduia sp. 21SJ11W-1]UTA48755.1 LPS assembly lipoprotein LptE [Simiduia sp. 21SJ11W-1]